MKSMMLQIIAVLTINIKSLPQRFWMSTSTIGAVALVVAVLLGFLAMANGFQKTISGTGSQDTAIVLREGSQAELNSVISRPDQRIIEEAPGVARQNGAPVASGELYVVVDGVKKASQTEANLPLRGVGPMGLNVREGFKITKGRMFASGSNEVVAGAALLREFSGFELGRTVRFGTSEWKVVGVFEANGSIFESELWADLPVVQSLFNRGSAVQVMRLGLSGQNTLEDMKSYLLEDQNLDLDIYTEQDYFAEQASQTTNFIQYLGWPLGVAMALGALAGALNTMYSSVASRASEIATLRAIGFSGFSAFVGTLAEALVLSAMGAVLGVLIAWAFFDGISTSTLGASFTQVVFTFELSLDVIVQALILALAIGLIGGILPAVRAARQNVAAAFQTAE